MSEHNVEINLQAIADRILDASVTGDIRKAAQQTNDPFMIGAIELFIQYGITGRKLAEFIQRLDALNRLKEALPTKGGDT